MLLSNYLKAAAKTAAAALVVFLTGIGIPIPFEALEAVLSALIVGGGSLLVNALLVWVQKYSWFSWARKLIPGYENESTP